MEKVCIDYRGYEVVAAEEREVQYDRVEDYDPVLRSHCRLDEPVPNKDAGRRPTLHHSSVVT